LFLAVSRSPVRVFQRPLLENLQRNEQFARPNALVMPVFAHCSLTRPDLAPHHVAAGNPQKIPSWPLIQRGRDAPILEDALDALPHLASQGNKKLYLEAHRGSIKMSSHTHDRIGVESLAASQTRSNSPLLYRFSLDFYL
jgi:hypothetical protein